MSGIIIAEGTEAEKQRSDGNWRKNCNASIVK